MIWNPTFAAKAVTPLCLWTTLRKNVRSTLIVVCAFRLVIASFKSWWMLIMWRCQDDVVPLAQTASGRKILRLQRLPHFPSRRPWSPLSTLIVRQGDEPEHRLVHHLVHLETLVGDAGVVAVHREAKLHQGLRQLGLVSHLVRKCAVMNSMTGSESNRSFLTNLKLWKEQSHAFCPQCQPPSTQNLPRPGWDF